MFDVDQHHAGARDVALRGQYPAQFYDEQLCVDKGGLQNSGVAASQVGLVERFDDRERLGNQRAAAGQQHAAAVAIVLHGEVLAVERVFDHLFDDSTVGYAHGHEMEDGAVRVRDVRQRAAAAGDEGDVGDRCVLLAREGEYAVLLAQGDAVLAEHVAGDVEQLAGRQGFGQAEGDRLCARRDAGRDDETHAELLGEHFVNEGDQRQIVEAHLDGRAGELVA